jgi:uncharacterized protein YacL (UPF0231 family)
VIVTCNQSHELIVDWQNNKCKQNIWKIQGGKISHFDYTLIVELDINVLLPNFS